MNWKRFMWWLVLLVSSLPPTLIILDIWQASWPIYLLAGCILGIMATGTSRAITYEHRQPPPDRVFDDILLDIEAHMVEYGADEIMFMELGGKGRNKWRIR